MRSTHMEEERKEKRAVERAVHVGSLQNWWIFHRLYANVSLMLKILADMQKVARCVVYSSHAETQLDLDT